MIQQFDKLAAIADADHADTAHVAVPVSLIRQIVQTERANAVMRAAHQRVDAMCDRIAGRPSHG